jgi:hypothetical protein
LPSFLSQKEKKVARRGEIPASTRQAGKGTSQAVNASLSIATGSITARTSSLKHFKLHRHAAG